MRAVVAALLLATAPALTDAQTPPVINEIRIHGNHSTPDAEVVTLSGLAVGQPATDDALAAAKARVEASGRFETVAVRRLERSIDVPDDFMVMVLVEERPGVTIGDLQPGWVRRVMSQRMWLPVLRYEEGYGLTYGLRTALEGVFGGTSRLGVPATWGGERRIGLEAERSFDGPLVSRVSAGVDFTRTVHPAFERAEERVGVSARLERRLAAWTTFGVEGRHDRVRFAGRRDDVDRVTADLVVDTREDPSFPRNAIWGRAAIEQLDVVTGVRRRTRADASVAIGTPLASAIVVRGFHTAADGSLPPYEQTMIGGWRATRGYRRGYRVADNAAGVSVSLARPFGSPLASVRHGIRVFADWAAAYDAGTKLEDASFDRGIGAGWFANLAAVNVYVDVGRNQDGRWRTHVRLGTGF